MDVPCVRVRPEAGEATRRRLLEAELLEYDFEITVEEGWLYVPVRDPDAVPDDLEVVSYPAPERETQTTPADLLGFEPSYERVGDVVVLDEDDPGRAREIARAVVDSDLPVRTVLEKASKVKGETRIRDWEVLEAPGDSDRPTETVHREYGHSFAIDLAEVYFSPRLATERHRVTEQVAAGERVVDMFAGVGPFTIPLAARGAECVAVDLNEHAIAYLEENAERNGVADAITAICGDVREVATEYADWADRLVMNLPHSAEDFLEAAVTLAGEECVCHYYDIQHEDDPFGPGERAIREAAAPAYAVHVEHQQVVRSYSPHEVNVCLDVRLERTSP